jgi:hypothetical protein
MDVPNSLFEQPRPGQASLRHDLCAHRSIHEHAWPRLARLVLAIMALEGPSCGCAVDHREHVDCKPEKLRATQELLEETTGKGADEISAFLVLTPGNHLNPSMCPYV